MEEYIFIRDCDGEVKKKVTNNLDEFKDFCHYSSLSDWSEHKKLIEKCLEKGSYAFTGNDVKYYIFNVEEVNN